MLMSYSLIPVGISFMMWMMTMRLHINSLDVRREKTEYLGTTAKAPPQCCSVIKSKMADELN